MTTARRETRFLLAWLAMVLCLSFWRAASGATPGEAAAPSGTPGAPSVAPKPAAAPAPVEASDASPEHTGQRKTPVTLAKETQLPADVGRGHSVLVPLDGLQAEDHVAVVLNDSEHRIQGQVHAGNVQFEVPANAKPGRYTVRLFVSGSDAPLVVPGEFRILPDDQAKPVITNAPRTIYPPDKGTTRDFVVTGQHFGNERDTTVEFANHDTLRATANCASRSETPCITVSPDRIEVHGFQPAQFEGPVKLTVRVGELASAPWDMTFARVQLSTVRDLAAVVTLLLAIVVIALARPGMQTNTVDGALRVFFLDKDTNSYSLSKLQILLWTTASVFAYTYFLLCRLYVQWGNEFPDVPDGMPALLGVSAGTSVAATLLTATRGPKGAGPLSPTFADFVSSGGVMAPERFQFFVWTIMGVVGFVWTVLSCDPATLSKLPEIPANFLLLMGFSSAGYLGGKAVRRPGPVITGVNAVAEKTADEKKTILTLQVDGQNLDGGSSVRLDGQDYKVTASPEKRTQQDASTFFTHLEWTLTLEGFAPKDHHQLEIISLDGQKATDLFDLSSPQP